MQQRHEVPQNFRRLLSSRLRRLVAQDKLEKGNRLSLGLSLGASFKASAVWDVVEERFSKRLAPWKRQYPSKGGTLTLLKKIHIGVRYVVETGHSSSKEAWVDDVWEVEGGMVMWNPCFLRRFQDW
ncbi:hypothetical protein CK203_072337 [Vitis vinifera]|uniref:Uncharacterized protein n=1 Tax=Vitis vinifera TaxID=29760 RepID=A0A438E7W3_VITVI|nr:hypothetical protein CK203_072337 [Vitis vinifera]